LTKATKAPGKRPAIVPTALKKLRGSVNVTREKGRRYEPQPEEDLGIEPPHWLADEAQASWRYAIANAPRGLLKALDRSVFVAFCIAEATHRKAAIMQAQLDQRAKLPLLMRGARGLEISKYVTIMERQSLIMLRCADQLGFTPASRPRISLIPPGALPPMIEGEAEPAAWGVLGHLHGEAA
jgi:P27 family predicted phage terminase small subunit